MVHSQFSPSQSSLYSSSTGLPYASTISYFDAYSDCFKARTTDRNALTENVENFNTFIEPIYYDCETFPRCKNYNTFLPIKEEVFGEV